MLAHTKHVQSGDSHTLLRSSFALYFACSGEVERAASVGAEMLSSVTSEDSMGRPSDSQAGRPPSMTDTLWRCAECQVVSKRLQQLRSTTWTYF